MALDGFLDLIASSSGDLSGCVEGGTDYIFFLKNK